MSCLELNSTIQRSKQVSLSQSDYVTVHSALKIGIRNRYLRMAANFRAADLQMAGGVKSSTPPNSNRRPLRNWASPINY